LEKGDIKIDIRTHGMRMDIAPLAGLWSSLPHLVRNAIDHGLESPEERVTRGKPPVGRLLFESLSEGDTIVLAVEDDGRGIDWPRVAEKAKERGLPHATRRDLEKALFSDGLSTRSEVTDVSGRGVGMSAVLAEVERLGGTLRIHSTPRRGTRFECVVPVPKKGVGPRVFGGKKAA
jgi:two-component system chemotaxis sensor kinase CheA